MGIVAPFFVDIFFLKKFRKADGRTAEEALDQNADRKPEEGRKEAGGERREEDRIEAWKA